MNPKSFVFETNFDGLETSLSRIFEAMELKEVLKKENRILLKLNLTTNLSYPVTTHPEFVKKIIEIIRKFSDAEIIICEGSGGCDTRKAFRELGYKEISKEFGVKLVDLNREERVKLKNDKALKLKEVWLPKILFSGYLISLPIPKEHSSALLTCALKNQFGIYLSKKAIKEYDKEKLENEEILVVKELQERGWSKGELHSIGVHESIFDLNLYRKPDLTICDGRIGVKGHELGGEEFKIGKIFSSFDPVALDSYLAKIFGIDWKRIKYLAYSNNILGKAENFEIKKV
jgi:uncharacterized protein (DUF362 family)